MTTIIIHNVETGEISERPMTPDELKQQIRDQQEWESILAERLVTQQQRQALLDRLGITEDEAKLLLS